jgi:hypothetical protein
MQQKPRKSYSEATMQQQYLAGDGQLFAFSKAQRAGLVD